MTKDQRTSSGVSAPAAAAARASSPTPGKQTRSGALGAGTQPAAQTEPPGIAQDGATPPANPATASGTAPAVPPVPGIDQPGFVDCDDAAELRADPTGAPAATDVHLRPGTRVFVTGSHPRAPAWWYATAFVDKAAVRGYVPRARITTDLPEPLAELHQVVAGDTAERLARKKFGGAVRDGHDLRYYENVLRYVNRDRKDAAITGSYQAPDVLGGGANNLQLIAGKRLWLVSPAYARAVESAVPSGSLTGGAVAKVKRVVSHVEDIVASVMESRHHLDEVAGEYAQLIRDHMPAIIGTLAGFALAEAASAFLAATPTGVGQALAAMIQLTLALLGVKNLVEIALPALSHGNAWLLLAWHAKGNRAQITLASKELLHMLVQLALAALTYRGIKQNLGNAANLASSLPPGTAPAVATSGAVITGTGAATAAKLGPSGLGPLGAGGAMMSKHDDAPAGPEPAAREGKAPTPEASKGAKPASKLPEPKPTPPSAAPAKGRGLPEYPVAKTAIEAKIYEQPDAIVYEMEAPVSGKRPVKFGDVTLPMTDGQPSAPPEMGLSASTFLDGVEHVPKIYDNVTTGMDGRLIGTGAKTPLTRFALDKFGQFYQRRFGVPITTWKGWLAQENKLNFQREYARLRRKFSNAQPETLAVVAVKRISFGAHRIAAGFTKFSVQLKEPQYLDLGVELGIQRVPTDITVFAEKP